MGLVGKLWEGICWCSAWGKVGIWRVGRVRFSLGIWVRVACVEVACVEVACVEVECRKVGWEGCCEAVEYGINIS